MSSKGIFNCRRIGRIIVANQASLDEAVETNEFSIFQLALRNVVEAQGGISEVSSKMDVRRESFYKSLSQKGKPRFSTIMYALKSCGVEIDFHPAHG